jgi:hypothetical protein
VLSRDAETWYPHTGAQRRTLEWIGALLLKSEGPAPFSSGAQAAGRRKSEHLSRRKQIMKVEKKSGGGGN